MPVTKLNDQLLLFLVPRTKVLGTRQHMAIEQVGHRVREADWWTPWFPTDAFIRGEDRHARVKGWLFSNHLMV